MDIEELERDIKLYIESEIGDEVHNINVRILKPEEQPLNEGYVLLQENQYAAVTTCYIHTAEITVHKPASKIDMIKAGLPYFIQRLFPPKRIDENVIVGVPGHNNYLPKQKLAVYGHFTEEMLDACEMLVEFIGKSSINAIRSKYKYVIVRL